MFVTVQTMSKKNMTRPNMGCDSGPRTSYDRYTLPALSSHLGWSGVNPNLDIVIVTSNPDFSSLG